MPPHNHRACPFCGGSLSSIAVKLNASFDYSHQVPICLGCVELPAQIHQLVDDYTFRFVSGAGEPLFCYGGVWVTISQLKMMVFDADLMTEDLLPLAVFADESVPISDEDYDMSPAELAELIESEMAEHYDRSTPVNSTGWSVDVGMLGSGNSKGDGPSGPSGKQEEQDFGTDASSRALSRRDGDSRPKAEQSRRGKHGQRPPKNSNGPSQKPPNPPGSGKRWKEKKRAGASQLVNQQLTQDLQKSLGEQDALVERLTELKEKVGGMNSENSPSRSNPPPETPSNSSSPPPLPPGTNGSENKKKTPFPFHQKKSQDLNLNFWIYQRVAWIGLRLHIALISSQIISMCTLVAILMLSTLPPSIHEAVLFHHDVDLEILNLLRMISGFTPLSLWQFLYPHLLMSFAVCLFYLVMGVNLYSPYRGHHFYKAHDLESITDKDVRADVLSLGELKHKEPSRQTVVYAFKTMWSTKRQILNISAELLAQISTSDVLDIGAEEAFVWQRIRHVANHMQSINLDRYEVIHGKFVVADTSLVAYGLWKHQQQERKDALFPRTQMPL